jgi:hypothetical protein
MSFELTSESGSERQFRGGAWALILNVGEAYGWIPAGTLPPEGETDDEWPGNYDSSEGQLVARADAANLATALTAALADPQRRDRQRAISRELDRVMHEMKVEEFGEDEIGLYKEDPDPQIIADEALRDCIAFFSEGAFRID